MAKVVIPENVNVRGPYSGPFAQKRINTTRDTWHAQIPGGGAVALTAAFTNPNALYADRIPELALAAGGTPGAYVLVGLWNGAAQTATITTVANETVKADVPFDTITGMAGPDPVNPLDIYHGDSFADPPARGVWTGVTGGDLECMLFGESAVQIVPGLPANIDWIRTFRRIGRDNTTIPTLEAWLVW